METHETMQLFDDDGNVDFKTPNDLDKLICAKIFWK